MARAYRSVSGLQIRLACAAILLTFAMCTLAVGSRFGVVHLNAGEMTFVFGPSEDGLGMGMAARGCPPHCGFDVNWSPASAHTGLGL